MTARVSPSFRLENRAGEENAFGQALEPRFRCADIVVNGIPHGCPENEYAVLCPRP